MDIADLKRRFQRCVAAQAGVLSKEDATRICRAAILGSRNIQLRSTRRQTNSAARHRKTSHKRRNRA
jgi:hypothetical protein